MKLKPIRAGAGHRAALAEMEAPWNAPDGCPVVDQRE